MSHDTVTVNLHEAHGRVYARSEELFGLILSDDNRSDLLSIIPKAIEVLYQHRGLKEVKVSLSSSSPDIEIGPGGSQRYDVEFRP
jgi:hypothetical protein